MSGDLMKRTRQLASIAAALAALPLASAQAQAPRIAPITPEDSTPEGRAFIEELAKSPQSAWAAKLNLVTTMAHEPEAAKRYYYMGSYFQTQSPLPAQVRELTILRTAWLHRSDYIWVKHARTAERVGLTPAAIAATKTGADAAGLSDFERQVIRASDELRADTRIGDATWAALAAKLDRKQMIDLVLTAGNYAMLAMFLNSTGVQLETTKAAE
jgi:alkylhydroperoxidase family enzyme